MTTLTLELPDKIKALAEAQAAEAGCADVAEYLTHLIRGEAAGGPPSLTVNSDDELESLLLARLNGPSVEMNAADFDQMREKLKRQLDSPPESRP